MASLKEKIGYGLGDASNSIFWKICSYYLPIFYADVFGLSLAQVGTLIFVTRFWDTLADPAIGIIVDRTQTKVGKYRPYLLWFSVPFCVCGVLLFTTPNLGNLGKAFWAYATYIFMMTCYTAINVPYAAMLNAQTDNSHEKTVFTSFRMFYAYAGAFIAIYAWEPLCNYIEHFTGSAVFAWEGASLVYAPVCLVLFLLCFAMTKERISVEPTPLRRDIKSLFANFPWWLLSFATVCNYLFITIRGTTVAFYFKYYLGENIHVNLGFTSIFLYAGLFLAIGELCSMAGTVMSAFISKRLGKRDTFVSASALLVVLSVLFFYLPLTNTGFIIMIVLQSVICILTGIIAPLVWSMYGDVAVFSQWKDDAHCNALVFSSGTLAQKMGCTVAGTSVLVILDSFGYTSGSYAQSDEALFGMQLCMGWIPAFIAIVQGLVMLSYPLTKNRMAEIAQDLKRPDEHNVYDTFLVSARNRAGRGSWAEEMQRKFREREIEEHKAKEEEPPVFWGDGI